MSHEKYIKEKYGCGVHVIDLPSDSPVCDWSDHRIDVEGYLKRFLGAICPREGNNTLNQLASRVARDACEIRTCFNAAHESVLPLSHIYGVVEALQVLTSGMVAGQPGGRKIPGRSYQIINNGPWAVDANGYVDRFLGAVRIRVGDSTLGQLAAELNRDANTIRKDFTNKSFDYASRQYRNIDVLRAVTGRIVDQPVAGNSGGPIPPGAKHAPLSKALAL
jgi:hypothetical protein